MSNALVTLDFGVRLPLADDYRDAGHGQLESAPVVYVVNEEGEVIARP